MRIISLRMQGVQAANDLQQDFFLPSSAGLKAPSVQYGVPFCIRDFHKEDFEKLWRIDQQCFSPGISYSRPELAAYIRMAGAFTLVAEAQAGAADSAGEVNQPTPENAPRVLGFIVATMNARRIGHIVTIDVSAEARRSGIGSALLDSAEERLQSAGCASVLLETAVNNTSALVFYKRHSYSVSKTIPRYYPDGVDAFVLKKNLLSEPQDR